MPPFFKSLVVHLRPWCLGLLAFGAAMQVSSQTVPVSGARVAMSTNQACPFFCNEQFSFDGGTGSFLAAAQQQRATDWSAWGEAMLTGPQSMPQLKAYAATPSQGRYFAAVESYGIQMFTYHGPDVTRQLNISLSGSGSAVNLDVYVYNGSDFMSAVANGIPPWYSPGTVVNEVGVRVKGSTNLNGYNENGQSFLYTDSLSIDLVDGEDVVLWTLLEARSSQGSIADGGHTAIMGFNDFTGLTPQLLAAPVPEPEQLWMLLPGMAIVVLVAGRRRVST